MSVLAIVPAMIPAELQASRGTGVANLSTRDPKEVWADTAAPGEAVFTVDLGAAVAIDTVWLGAIRHPRADATWRISGGIASAQEQVIQPASALRVPDAFATSPLTSCALWFGTPATVRYLSIAVDRGTAAPLTIGRLIVGRAFTTALGQEWGAGRRPIDTGTATALASGGFAVVDGVRKRYFGWTFGDLSAAEVEALETIAFDHGETVPLLVIDDPRPTPGLLRRILYGKFDRWKPFERRNRAQTRWDIGFEEWV